MARDVITVKPTDVLYGIDEYKRIRHLPPWKQRGFGCDSIEM
jgi:hypothetical protein